MQLSRKSDYALRALICLAESSSLKPGSNIPVSVRDLAERNGIPRKYLESIMGDLKTAEIVESIAGKFGGYRLKKSPADISLGDIINLFDGSLFSPPSDSADSGTADPQCTGSGNAHTAQVQRMLLHIGSELNQLLTNTSLQSILDDKPIHYLITNQDEFTFGDGI